MSASSSSAPPFAGMIMCGTATSLPAPAPAAPDALEEEDYATECLGAIAAWTVQLQNELELLGITEQVLELWNYLVGIDYGRDFQIMSLRYTATVGSLERIQGVRFSYVGGPCGELSSYAINAPNVQLRSMRSSKDSGRRLEKLPLGPVASEIASIKLELAQLAALRQSLVDCAPPHGREYRLALRRAGAHGMGRYALRPNPPSRNRAAA